ncbi:hypothetical protein N7486_007526 [Penicillium sp. IBT 16267x]|nr:hypothetical protein N7486_007526 [Penicillium sp. IBT 16267x]
MNWIERSSAANGHPSPQPQGATLVMPLLTEPGPAPALDQILEAESQGPPEVVDLTGHLVRQETPIDVVHSLPPSEIAGFPNGLLCLLINSGMVRKLDGPTTHDGIGFLKAVQVVDSPAILTLMSQTMDMPPIIHPKMRIGVEETGVTIAVNQLEEEVGVPVFEDLGRGCALSTSPY